MEVQFGPNAHDEPDLLYKLQRKIKVFDTSDPLPNRGYCLVASASKYGAIFVGTPDGKLAVYRLKELVDKETEPCHLPVQLQEKPTHIAVNCDNELLAVTGGRMFVVFKVAELLNQNVSPSLSVQFDVSPSTFVSDVKWNPCIPDTIAYAFYDGSIAICQSGQGMIKKLQSSARCLCWSPKGKQLVVGNNDGTICQYKPDLSLMKSFPAPDLFQGAPVEVMAIYWISTFQFAVVYKNAADNSKPAVTIVNTPKGGQPSCLNYEDVCYSTGSNRPWYYCLHGLAQWNVILCSSSNSMEIATLGSTDGASWLQWCQSDEARPELPLIDKKEENYPIGIAIDTAAVHQLPWGENEKLPFMPMLHVLSQTGLLTIFNIINLNKQAPQIATPVTIVSTKPFPAQSQPTAAPQVEAAPQPKPEQRLPPPQQLTPAAPAPASFGLSTNTQSFATVSVPTLQQQPQQQQAPAQPPKPAEVQPPAPVHAPAQPKPVYVTQAQKDQTQEINAALKAEQEMANKQKANQEFKSMLVQEVNEFQMELYDFVVKTRKAQLQFYRELHAIDTNAELQNLDAATLRKDCSVEDLRSAIIALKLDLVRACAVVAEARTHSDAKDLDQWTQADPLTMKRVANVKKLSYYVQNQLEQAHRALDYRWNQMIERDIKASKPGPRMTRPIMDDVYQPLVKQQEILSRQEAVLKMLKNTLKECEGTPVYKSTILRSTPFKNKDQLSKLTKNILNMSLEPPKSENKNLLTPQKLDALRDMLSNHKTVKIKPVNVEMRHHMAAMRLSYEKSIKERANELVAVKKEPDTVKVEVKQEFKQPPAPVFTPIVVKPSQPGNLNWYTEETKQELPSPQIQTPKQTSFTIPTTPATAITTQTALKDLLQNKQVTVQVKKDDNTLDSFMGQKICSPSNFNFSSVIVATPTSFTTKPISSLNNMLNQFAPEGKSSETGEPDNTKEEKQMLNLFKMTTSTPIKPSPQNAPDVLGNSNMISIKRVEPKVDPKTDKASEKSKENVAVKADNVILSIPKVNKEDKKENEPKPLGTQNTNKPLFSSIAQPVATPAFTIKSGDALKSVETKSKLEIETPKTQKSAVSTTSASVFATANATITVPKPKSIFGSTPVTSTPPTAPFQAIAVSKPGSSGSIFATVVPSSSTAAKTEASSIFASANSLITSKPQSSSIFSASFMPSSVFGSSGTSIFGTATTTQSSVAETTTASAAKPGESTSTSTASTASSLFGSTTKSVFSSATAATTTATPVSTSSPTATSADVFGTVTQPSSTTTQAATTAQSVFGSTTATTKSVSSAPVSTTSSIFGSASSTTQPSIFGGTPTSTTSAFGAASTTSASVFGSTATISKPTFGSTTQDSVTASTATTPAFGTTTTPASTATTQASIFGGTTSQASVFGSTVTTPASVFGSATATQAPAFGSTTTQASVFGSTATTPTSVFGTAATKAPAFGTATSPTPAFGTTATTQASVFGTPTTTQASVFGTPTTTQASVFGTPTTTQASVFGTPTTTQASVFGTPTTTQASVFGTPTTTQASVFGSPTTTQASVFGTPTTTQASVFGSPTTQASVFGSPATTQASVFGSPATSQPSGFGTPATQASVFGSPTTQPSVFGTPTTQASVFGSPQTTQASVFGATSPSVFGTQTSQSSVFGAAASPASVFGSAQTQAPVFGTPTQSTQASVFGTPTQSTQASVFGTPTPTTQASVFGTPATTTQSSVFGTPGQSVFGAPATTTQSSSMFGGGESLFASVNISTTSASQSGGSIFGGGSTGTSGFGSGSNVFGGKTTFGQPNPTAEAIFGGGGGGFGQTAPQSQSNNFWGSNNNSSGGFGSSGFGQQPTTQGSVFGTGSFSAPSPPGQAFGSPTSSTGGFGSGFGSKAVFGQPSGFGSPTSSGFGAPASFGGFNKSPGGFGAPAAFGGAPAFGGSAFGSTSPGSVFGNTSPSTGFGSPTQSNATFESLATQNTLTFGNLAQQTAQPPQPAPSFNASPSFTGWRG